MSASSSPQSPGALSVAVVGAGLIGRERINAVRRLAEQGRPVVLSGVYDPVAKPGSIEVPLFPSFDHLLRSRPNWVFIATPHDTAVGLVEAALKQGCKVLAEKPLGRDFAEADRVTRAAQRPDQLFVGFNYRFLDGIAQAVRDKRDGFFGKIICINMILAHGHSPDMRGSWKLDPVRAGGGCLIDPGIHLLDLAFLLSGSEQLTPVGGRSWSGFWNTGIEEECHLLLESPDGGATINLQTSIVRWRSAMTIEIHGQEGYALIEGRNRSFGAQRYTRGRRWAWRNGGTQRQSEELALVSDNEEVFLKETTAVLFPGEKDEIQPCSGDQSLRNMRLLHSCRAMIGLPEAQLPSSGT